MASGNNTKMNISYTIRAVDRFTNTHQKLQRQLDSVERKVESLDDKTEVKVDADTKPINRKVDRTKRKIKNFPKLVYTHFTSNLNSFQNDIQKTANMIQAFDEVFASIGVGSLLMMAPALSPIISTLLGGLGAIGSAFGSAGLGAGGFAAVAIPSISRVYDAYDELKGAQEAVDEAQNADEHAAAMENLEKVTSNYNEAQLESVSAIQDFSKFFNEFQSSFEPEILDIFSRSLGTVEELLVLMEPAIWGVTEAVSNLLDSFNDNLEASDVQEFFGWLGDTAGPNLEKLTQAVGNFIMGFFNMLVAFDPLAQSFMDGFLDMSESFREWGATLDENQQFQDFMAFVEETTPTVLSLFGNMIDTIIAFGEAAEPVTTAVLNMTDSFFEWAAELFETHEWIAQVLALLPVLVGIMKVLSPIIDLVKAAFAFLWPVIVTVVKVGTKLWNVFKTRLIPIAARVGGALLRLGGGPFALIIQVVAALAIVVIKNWDAIWAKTKEIFGWIADWAQEKWNQVLATATIVAAFVGEVKDYFSDMWGRVKERMGEIKDWILDKWNEAVAVASIISGFIKKVKGFFGDMKEAVFGRMEEIKGTVEDLWGEVESFLDGIDLFDIGRSIIDGLMGGIKSMGSSLVESAKGVVDGAIQGAKNLLNINSPSKVFEQIGVFTGQGFIEGMDGMQRRVTQSSERMSRASIPAVQAPAYQGVNTASAPNYQFRNNRNGSDNTRTDENGRQYTVEVPVYLNGKQIAKASADDITKIQNRKKRTDDKFKG